MKNNFIKACLISTVTVIALPFVEQLFVHAATSNVSITNNSDSSSNNVNVYNKVGTSQSTDNSSQTNTHIRIEQNGKVQEYNSDKPGDVVVQSEDGNSRVEVNNKTNGENIVITPNPTEKQKKNEIKKKIEAKKIEVRKKAEEHRNAVQQLIDSLRNFLKNFNINLN